MFERIQKPFLTVETGEAYGPVRLDYDVYQPEKLIECLNALTCCEKSAAKGSWNWLWRGECNNLHFESLTSQPQNLHRPMRLGTLVLSGDHLFISLPSFKRACLAVPFFHRHIPPEAAKISKADFINKIFSLNERLPHGFTELFKDEELDRLVHERVEAYETMQTQLEAAETAESAMQILEAYTKSELAKRLPYVERYDFNEIKTDDAEVLFLSFYIFLRSRELVSVRRWFGETGFNLGDATDEMVKGVFGDLGINMFGDDAS